MFERESTSLTTTLFHTRYQTLHETAPDLVSVHLEKSTHRKVLRAAVTIDCLDDVLPEPLTDDEKTVLFGFYLFAEGATDDEIAVTTSLDLLDENTSPKGQVDEIAIVVKNDENPHIAQALPLFWDIFRTVRRTGKKSQITTMLADGYTEEEITTALGVDPILVKVEIIRRRVNEFRKKDLKSVILKAAEEGTDANEFEALQRIFPGERALALEEVPERYRVAVNTVAAEYLAYQQGARSALSPVMTLYASFAPIGASTIEKVFKKVGLTELRNKIMEYKLLKNMEPSEDFAWVLAALAAGGTAKDIGQLSLNNADENLQREFVEVGRKLFQLKPHPRTENKGEPSQYDTPAFYSRMVARLIGDLRREAWPTTIRTRYPWILEDERFARAFIRGVFDIKGNINSKAIQIHVSTDEERILLHELFQRIGINATPVRRKGTAGSIQIWSFDTQKQFAEQITSHVVRKEKLLENLRRKPLSEKGKQHPTAGLIAEWKRICKYLGREPIQPDIDAMRKSESTPYSAYAYSYRFGRVNGKGRARWSLAKDNLRILCNESEAPETSGEVVVFSADDVAVA